MCYFIGMFGGRISSHSYLYTEWTYVFVVERTNIFCNPFIISLGYGPCFVDQNFGESVDLLSLAV